MLQSGLRGNRIRKKVITEAAQKPQTVAQFKADNQLHDIIHYNNKYIIRFNVDNNKAKSVRCGVHSLPVAVNYLKKRFPNAEQV